MMCTYVLQLMQPKPLLRRQPPDRLSPPKTFDLHSI